LGIRGWKQSQIPSQANPRQTTKNQLNMKTILFLGTAMSLIFGSVASTSAGPLGTYEITVKGAVVENGESHPVRAKGTLKLSSTKGELTVMNLSGNQGKSRLVLSKPIKPTALMQDFKGTINDPKFDGKGSFSGKLTRSGTHYNLTASMRIVYPDGVMKGTLTGTK
jgi:hypothetical protein